MTDRSEGTSTRVPTGAVVADVIVAMLVLVGVYVTFFGALETFVGGSRWSISRTGRVFAAAMIIAAVRHWFVPRHPALRRLIVREGIPETEVDPGRRWSNQPLSHFLIEAVVITAGFAAFVSAWTWPQVANLHGVPDMGDPLFSTWRVAWIAHQIVRDPLHLFDGNIFHPERLTLTYSDPVIVEGLMAAPFIWLGAHQLTVYTLLLLSGFVLSGVTMYFLVRRLTGRRGAAIVSGVIFAMCPYRFEHYPHLELQMAMWIPLVLIGVHRTIASGRLRDGVFTGVAFALQTLSSLYYGCYLAVFLVPVGLVLWIMRGRPMAPLRAFAAGAVVTAMMTAPVGYQYIRNKAVLGERGDDEVMAYSAKPGDYFEAHFRNRLWGERLTGGLAERQLFAGALPLALAASALWPPLSAVRLAYGLGLVVAVDGSFGFNGASFRWLREWLPPFRGLRVPARFALIVSFALAVLAGLGVARMLNRWPKSHVPIASVLVALVAFELRPRLDLETVWASPPDIYGSLSKEFPSVLAEFPVTTDTRGIHSDPRYMYFSTFHWQRLVNGNSGFIPPSYDEFLIRTRRFPSDNSIEFLKSRGVEYVALHGEFMSANRFRRAIRDLRRRKDVELVAQEQWQTAESRLYRLLRSTD